MVIENKTVVQYYLLVLLVIGNSFCAFSQGRLIINNNAYIVIDNSAYVVVANPATNAITTTGTGGNIVTESEFDRVKWNIGTSTGSYTVPLTNASGIKIPLTTNFTAAGTGSGSVLYSTYMGGTWDNNTYRPSDVTHMMDYASGMVNNSAEVIDRFWLIDANGYTTKPTVDISFTYSDAEWSTAGNSITEADLGAQRFNSTSSLWGDYLPVGSANTVANTVTGVVANSANFFRSWTLVDKTSPLPIELLHFDGQCENGNAKMEWTTATENNSDYFTLEKSSDGIHFSFVTQIAAAGFSNSMKHYSFIDYSSASLTTVYRLKETDRNGVEYLFPGIAVSCAENNTWDFTVSYSGGQLLFIASDLKEPRYKIEILDVNGKLIASGYYASVDSVYALLQSGVYIVRVWNHDEFKSKKLLVLN